MNNEELKELYRLASLVGCEPESEARHRADLLAWHTRKLKEAVAAAETSLDWKWSKELERKLKEAVREEWKLISEVAHSANITAELYIGEAREERLAELEERTDDPA